MKKTKIKPKIKLKKSEDAFFFGKKTVSNKKYKLKKIPYLHPEHTL